MRFPVCRSRARRSHVHGCRNVRPDSSGDDRAYHLFPTTGWTLTLTDGTVYEFGDNAPLQSIADRFGNTVTVTHANGAKGEITRVPAPSGRFVTFAYDASHRVTQATDHVGRAATTPQTSLEALGGPP